ncbi:MAG: BLUF domain-containing protein [Pseudomonadota bacterium]
MPPSCNNYSGFKGGARGRNANDNEPPVVRQLLYSSLATPAFDEADLGALVATAQRNNRRSGVTGLLLYGERAFMQLLEGAEADVDTVFDRIRRDPRHEHLRIVHTGDAPDRVYKNWSMGFRPLAQHIDSTAVFELSRRKLEEKVASVKPMEIGVFMRAFYDTAFPEERGR